MDDILIVDDEPSIAHLLVDILTDAGYQTRIATNGAEALLMIQESIPSLILLDMAMPVMNGYELLLYLRSHGYPDLPIVMMSAGTFIHQMRALGATDILPKPFILADLLARIDLHLLHAKSVNET